MGGTTLYRTLRLHRFDPEMLANVLSQSKLEHFLMGSDPCDVVHEHWEDEVVLLDHAKYSFKAWVRGEFGDGRLCIGFIRDHINPCWINGTEVRSDEIVVFAEHSELAYRADRHTHWVATQVTRDYLQTMALEFLGEEVELPSHGMKKYRPLPETMAQLRRVFDDFTRLVRRTEVAVECYKDMFVFALVAALGGVSARSTPSETAKLQQAMLTVKRAEAFILSNLAHPYSSSDFAGVLSMTERNVELQFKRMFGMSPHRWRECFGLNMAYRRLARARWKAGLVSDVAMECGFSHAGRFSSSYGKLFHELPHETGRGMEPAKLAPPVFPIERAPETGAQEESSD
ncbi:AraC family transcriptional regulator [Verrucomicrobium sp. BvORR106]|uniref:helix-turn-helix domain-containing protein n=1 Tax=Verrucomicrobium sp. BvORR106 TaxID=1403819 RepID=UPI00056FFC4B|nr:AraC family transcriptional regulator [Verrucomicrobium sp. BvORR106]